MGNEGEENESKSKVGQSSGEKKRVSKRRKNKSQVQSQEEVKNLGGAPVKEIDWALVDNLCAIQCTAANIAAKLGVSVDTLGRRIQEKHGIGFAEYFEQKRQPGLISLRQKSFQMAMAGDVRMLKHLGEVYLDQRPAASEPQQRLAEMFVDFMVRNQKQSDEDDEE